MPTIADSRITVKGMVPVKSWRWQSLIQCFVVADDPKTKARYLFAAQARQVGKKGDREDAYFHRHIWRNGTWVYLDTMHCIDFGHVQNFHVRISALSNPQIWAGVEQYDRLNKATGLKVARFMYQGGKTITPDPSSKFAWIDTGIGSNVSVVDSPDWYVVLRRSAGGYETYELHDERALIKGYSKANILKSVRFKKPSGTYQGACANKSHVFCVRGSTSQRQVVDQHSFDGKVSSTRDVTAIKPSVTDVKRWARSTSGSVTSGEVEGAAIVDGILVIGRRFNSLLRRVYGLFEVRW